MPRPPSVIPTDGELEILEIVWRLKKPSTRDVFEAVSATRAIDQSTIITAMSVMERKGLLRAINDGRRPKCYEAVKSQKMTYRGMVKNLADKISGGSIKGLAMHLFGGREMTAAEEEQIRREFGEGK